MEINNFFLARDETGLVSLYNITSQPWKSLASDHNMLKKVELKINLPVLGAEQIRKAVYFYIHENSNNTTFESLFIQTDSRIIEFKKNGKDKGELHFPH